MKDIAVVIFLILFCIVSVYVILTVNFPRSFKRYGLDIRVGKDLTNNEYTESMIIINSGGKVINDLFVSIRLSIGCEGKDVTRICEFKDLRVNGSVSVELFTSDREGYIIGGTTVFQGNQLKHEVAWESNAYTGTIEISFDDRSIRKYLTLEKNSYSVNMYLHDY